MPAPHIGIELTFDAAHRIVGHEGKCRHIHGHTYRLQVQIEAADKKLNKMGMVADFAAVKGSIKNAIDKWWDHNLIVSSDDPIWKAGVVPSVRELNGGREPFRMEGPPTVENMCRLLYDSLSPGIAILGCTIALIKLYETPNCYAILYGDGE